MGKRGNGEGSIYQRKEDGKWVGSITLENRKRKVFYGKTRKEVQEKMKVALHEQQQGTLVTAPQQTVAQYLEYWLKVHKKNIRPRSHERYEEIVRLHLVPTLGNVKLDKLSPRHLDVLYTNKLESGLSPTTVTAIHNFLHTALDGAVRREMLSRNVCDLVSPPRKIHKEIKPLTPVQIRQLLDVAKGHPHEALFILALATGMRRGELLGLKWQDIDFVKGVLQVRRTLSRVPTKMVEELGTSYIESETKTNRSRRSIVLTGFAIEALKQHQARQLTAKQKAGDLWQEHNYVFCSPTGTYLSPGHNALVQLKKLLEKAGLPDIRFHDLRHSAATMLLMMGIHPKIVQEILGHSEISMTMDTYSHVLPGMQQDAMNKLHDALKREDDDEGMAGAGVPSTPKR
jgi:integrase